MLLGANLSAQTTAELEAAKAMAKSYGYSESEIEAMISGQTEKKETENGTTTELNLSAVKDQNADVVLTPAEEPKDSTAIYGHKFFASKGFNVIPSLSAPAPENYVLGTGDEIIIDLWGDTNVNLNGIIAKDGTIMVSGLGPVMLSGLTLKKAETALKTQLSKIYGGLGSDTKMKLSLGRAKAMTVNVVGDVLAPGAYSLPALASVTSAIFLAGGVEETASVRDIKVFRNGRLTGTFDLYKFIFDGAYDSNLRLQDNDIISVPSYKNLVTVEGEAKRPMIYEMIDGENLSDLLLYAGGFTNEADRGLIHVDRMNSKNSEAFEVNKEQFDSFLIEGGDVVEVHKANFFIRNRVAVEGSVVNPGHYAIGTNIKSVKDLINAAGGLAEDAKKDKAILYRRGDDLQPMALNISLREILSGREDFDLVREDSLFVFNAESLRDSTMVHLYGDVKHECDIPYREGMSLADAIIEAGGYLYSADISNIEIASKGRLEKGNIKKIDLISNPEAEKTVLCPEDHIFVRRLVNNREMQTIEIKGEITYPGTYVINKAEVRLSDIIERAGLPTENAYVKGARLERTVNQSEEARMEMARNIAKQMSTKEVKDSLDKLEFKTTYTIGIDLEKAMNNPGSDADVVLRKGDIISIPLLNNTVSISGAVFYPNVVVYNPKYGWRDYVNQAGGKSKNGKTSKIYAVYMNGMVARRGKAGFRMEPGMEIVVPKDDRDDRRMTTSELLAVASSTSSIGYIIVSMARMFL